jgi:hypothetical protein
MRRFSLGAVWLIGAALGSFLVLSGQANAQLVSVGIFKNLTNEQTGPVTVAPTGAFFNAGAQFSPAGEYDQASVSYPGPGSPESLPLTTPTTFGNGPSFPNQAAMDAAYPFGTYNFNVSSTSGPQAQAASVNYTEDAYTSDIPQLTAASFNALLGLNTGLSSLTLSFNSFTPNSLATDAFTFFTIFRSSQGCAFLSPSSTSCTISPQALTPGTTYTWELDFSDRIETSTNFAYFTYTDFDVRTDGTFTTAASAVPEPSTWALMMVGFAAIGFAAYRTARKSVAV